MGGSQEQPGQKTAVLAGAAGRGPRCSRKASPWEGDPQALAPFSMCPGQGRGSASAGFCPHSTRAVGPGEGEAAVPPAGDKGVDGGMPPMGESASPHRRVWGGLA